MLPGCVDDKHILQESEEDKGDANVEPHVDSLLKENKGVVYSTRRFLKSQNRNVIPEPNYI